MTGAQGPGGSRWGEDAAVFAGFTSTTVTGAAGGREQMNARCAAAFTGAHLCHVSEYGLANSATPPPATGAWIDASGGIAAFEGEQAIATSLAGPDIGRWVQSSTTVNCLGWTKTTNSTPPLEGVVIGAGGTDSADCTTSHPIACCSSPYLEKFAGFTTATTMGNGGGRAAMHARCGAQFPGSHLCHVAEYYRAQPMITPPAGGAWLDPSGVLHSSGEADVTANETSIHEARFLGSSDYNCRAWTNSTMGTGNPIFGEVANVDGPYSQYCNTSHALACCK